MLSELSWDGVALFNPCLCSGEIIRPRSHSMSRIRTQNLWLWSLCSFLSSSLATPWSHRKPTQEEPWQAGRGQGSPSPPCPCEVGANFDLFGLFHCFLLVLFLLLAVLPSHSTPCLWHLFFHPQQNNSHQGNWWWGVWEKQELLHWADGPPHGGYEFSERCSTLSPH